MRSKRFFFISAILFLNLFIGNIVSGNKTSGMESASVIQGEDVTIIGSETQGVVVELNNDGTIRKMKVLYADGWDEVEFRKDDYTGPGFGNLVAMDQKSQGLPVFIGETEGVAYQIAYTIEEGILQIKVSLQNNGRKDFDPKRVPFFLGIDTYMNSFPRWNKLYFPTFFRCEPTHFWGYMMTPLGRILGIACKDPVGSYTIEYQKSMYSHYIYTASLDLIQQPPVPYHHPVYKPLAVGEKRSWTIELVAINELNQIKQKLAKSAEAPMIDIYNYTLEPNNKAEFSIISSTPVSLFVKTPAGKELKVEVNKGADSQRYGATFSQTGEYGYYDVRVNAENGKVSTGSFFVRPLWSWYIKRGREEALRLTPRADLNGGADGYSCETYYGLLGFYLAAKHFPDPAIDVKGDYLLQKILDRLFKEQDGMYFSINKERIQNGSFMVSVLVDRYQATGDIEALEMANKFADYLLSRQHKDGYYGGYNMAPYTSVLYVAKAIIEFMEVEKELGKKEPKWQERYERHYRSVKLSIDDLVRKKLDVKTEGGSTFEDGSVSCSATQIALFALMQTDPSERKRYTDAALVFLDAHNCLTRLLATDTRSNGSTIRWWEAWADNKVEGQMTTSPHGWSGWRLYAVYYLYMLTGREDLLQGVMNALGSCSQLMEWPSGRLRQAYVVDPNVEAYKRIPDTKDPFGLKVPHVYSEEYLETIGEWYGKSTEGNIYMDRAEWAWEGDGIPYEIFKAMEEFALTAAYVIEREDGTIKTYNCSFQKLKNILTIIPAENIVNKVHFNLKNEYTCKVFFANKNTVISKMVGMKWLNEKD